MSLKKNILNKMKIKKVESSRAPQTRKCTNVVALMHYFNALILTRYFPFILS